MFNRMKPPGAPMGPPPVRGPVPATGPAVAPPGVGGMIPPPARGPMAPPVPGKKFKRAGQADALEKKVF